MNEKLKLVVNMLSSSFAGERANAASYIEKTTGKSVKEVIQLGVKLVQIWKAA